MSHLYRRGKRLGLEIRSGLCDDFKGLRARCDRESWWVRVTVRVRVSVSVKVSFRVSGRVSGRVSAKVRVSVRVSVRVG
jgi:hypothetical protein